MKNLFKCILFCLAVILCHGINYGARKMSQKNETLHNIIMDVDFYCFVTDGGGGFGYRNYYKWEYAKWRKDPKRTIFEKMMFWDLGILYDATSPPEEYEYPLL
ncbi:MAG: hypothetical protein WCX46_03090 [Candidatus Paceibacterota bacterium]